MKNRILNEMIHSVAGLLLLKPDIEEAMILSEICQRINELKRIQAREPIPLASYRSKHLTPYLVTAENPCITPMKKGRTAKLLQ